MTGTRQEVQMKLAMTVGSALIALILTASPALASQHHAAGQAQTRGQAAPPPQPGMSPGMMGPGGQMGMMAPGQTGMMCPMMGMTMHQPMMGGQMDPAMMAMMGMMGGGQMDPKTMSRMLQMRGEMLKAMGDVMLKHGKAMAEGK